MFIKFLKNSKSSFSFKCDNCNKINKSSFSETNYFRRKTFVLKKNKKKGKTFCNKECRKQFNNNRICSIKDCKKKVVARTYCTTHYSMWQMHGNPEGTKCKLCNCSIGNPKKSKSKYLLLRHKIMPFSCWECYFKNIRRVVIEKYGSKCNCCNEKNLMFLEIDHKYGGGSKEHKSLKRNRVYEKAFFNKNKYQILCANCNQGKFLNSGVCPHKKTNLVVPKKFNKEQYKKLNEWLGKNIKNLKINVKV